jgi:hypothetical protein
MKLADWISVIRLCFLDNKRTLATSNDQMDGTTEVACANVVALDQSVEGLAVNQIQDLGEDIATRVHNHRSCKQAL